MHLLERGRHRSNVINDLQGEADRLGAQVRHAFVEIDLITDGGNEHRDVVKIRWLV